MILYDVKSQSTIPVFTITVVHFTVYTLPVIGYQVIPLLITTTFPIVRLLQAAAKVQ